MARIDQLMKARDGQLERALRAPNLRDFREAVDLLADVRLPHLELFVGTLRRMSATPRWTDPPWTDAHEIARVLVRRCLAGGPGRPPPPLPPWLEAPLAFGELDPQIADPLLDLLRAAHLRVGPLELALAVKHRDLPGLKTWRARWVWATPGDLLREAFRVMLAEGPGRLREMRELLQAIGAAPTPADMGGAFALVAAELDRNPKTPAALVASLVDMLCLMFEAATAGAPERDAPPLIAALKLHLVAAALLPHFDRPELQACTVRLMKLLAYRSRHGAPAASTAPATTAESGAGEVPP